MPVSSVSTSDMPHVPSGTTDAAAASKPAVPETAAQAAAVPVETTEERLTDILRAHGFKATDENRAMLAMLLDNGFPLTKENITRMNQAMKLTDSPEQALFLLMNKMRLTQGNAAQLRGLAEGQTRMTDQINQLLSAVEGLDDPGLKEQILQILSKVNSGGKEAAQQPAAQTTAQGTQTAGQQTPAQGLPQTAEGQTPAPAQGTQTAGQPANTPPPSVAQPVNTAQPPAAPVTVTQSLDAPAPAAVANPNPSAAPQPPAQQAASPQTAAAPQPKAEVPTPPQTTITQPAPAGQSDPAAQASPIMPDQRQAVQQPSTPQASAPQPSTQTPEATAQIKQNADAEFFKASKDIDPSASPITKTKPHAALPRLSFKLADSAPQDIDRFINNLRDALQETRRAIEARPESSGHAAERVLREASALAETIDFTAQIKNQLFVQLPVFHNGQETQTALHVYKDAKKSNQGGSGGAASALIALETASMGHFETYVQKSAQSVNCQFRLQDRNVEQLVRAHIHELNALLKEYHYSLDAFSFLPQGEPYTLLDSPKVFDGEEDMSVGAERVVFDGKA